MAQPVIDAPDAIVELDGPVVEAVAAGRFMVARVSTSGAGVSTSSGGDCRSLTSVTGASRGVSTCFRASLFAAGLDTLVVLNATTGDAHRFKLSTGELRLASQLESDECRVLALLMGSHATGPLWMIREGQDLKQFDPQTFWPLPTSRQDGKRSTVLKGTTRMRFRVSGDGQTVAVWQPELAHGGFEQLVNSGGQIKVAHDIHSYGPVMPDFHGAFLLTQQKVLDASREPIETAPFQAVKDFAFLPAVTGPFCLRIPRACPLGTRRFKDAQDRGKKPATDVDLFVYGCAKPIHQFHGLPVFPIANQMQIAPNDPIEAMPSDRLFMLPEAETLTVIPFLGDDSSQKKNMAASELWLYRFDLDAGLRAAAVDRPIVYSQPSQLQVKPGEEFRYDVRAFRPGDAPIQYQLKTGPGGMKVDAQGRLSWHVADDTEPGRFPVAINARSVTGETRHKFVLELPVPESDIPRQRVMAPLADAEDARRTPPTPLAEPLIVDLPFSFTEAHYSGDYLVLRVLGTNQLAQFDLQRRVLTRFWEFGEREVVFAAGGGKLVLLYPDQMQLERWDLATHRCELSRQFPGTTAPNASSDRRQRQRSHMGGDGK